MIRQFRLYFMFTGLALCLACSIFKPAAPVTAVEPLSIDQALAKMPAASPEEGNALYAALMQDAPESVKTLCARLGAPGAGNDVQARFAIESLGRYVMRDAADAEREAYVKGITASLAKADGNEVKAFLIRKLQMTGRDESVATLAKYLTDDRLCEPATQALTRIGTPNAVAALQKALGLSQNKRRITLTQAMGVLQNEASVSTLISFVHGNDPAVSQAALDALANIGDPDHEHILISAMAVDDAFEKYHAYANYLRYARRLAENGHEKQALGIVDQLLETSASSSQDSIRSSALSALVEIDPKAALDEMITAMDSPHRDYRMAALAQARKITGHSATRRWVKKIETVTPEAQAEIIAMLARRGDTSALKAILQATGSDEQIVRLAAIEAAPRLGGDAAVPALIAALAKADKAETNAIKDQLVRLPGEKGLALVADALADQTAPARITLMEVLAMRHTRAQTEAIFAQATDADRKVRSTALKSLVNMANPKDLPRLIDLLFAADSKSKQKAIRKVIVAAAGRIEDPQTRADVILERLADAPADQQLALLPALSGVGGSRALQAVTEKSHSTDEAMRDVALRTLADWPDAEAAAALLDVIKGEAPLTHKVLALRGYVRLVKTGQTPADQKVVMLAEAMAAVPRPADKRLVLGALGEIHTPESFAVIAAEMESDAVAAEAAQAAIQIACPSNDTEPCVSGLTAATALRRACDLTDNGDLRTRAEKRIAAILAEEGYLPLFNGRDLTGWKGLMPSPNDNPINRAKLSPADAAAAQAEADRLMREHWRFEDGVFVFDGKGLSLATARDYGDFEMLVDWKILAKGDSGIYLRGAPQVQIWDTDDRPEGSGGLFNNQKNPAKPLVCADRPIGQWNTFHIKMLGERVTVHLNGQLVDDDVVMENYWDRNQPIFPTGQIELQNHGNTLYFRNVYLKEIPRKGLARPLFNGRDLAGWQQVGGAQGNWAVEDAVLYTSGKGGGWLSTVETFDNFDLSLDFRVPADGNSGLFLRTPREGDPAYVGMEIQVLDDYAEMYAKLAPFQYTGSIYGLSAPASRVSKPAGQWQTMRVRCQGPLVKVWLNGQQIQDADLGDYADQVDKHPGVIRSGGYIGMQDHGARVEYRNIMIEELLD